MGIFFFPLFQRRFILANEFFLVEGQVLLMRQTPFTDSLTYSLLRDQTIICTLKGRRHFSMT